MSCVSQIDSQEGEMHTDYFSSMLKKSRLRMCQAVM